MEDVNSKNLNEDHTQNADFGEVTNIEADKDQELNVEQVNPVTVENVEHINDMSKNDNSTNYVGLIEKIIEESNVNTYNVRMFMILILFFLADGGEMVVISLIVKKLGIVWNLTPGEKGFIGSGVFIGFYFGALVGGKLSDNIGRKPTFMIGAACVFVFGIISAFSPNYTFLLFMRACFGFGVGLAIPSSTSLLTELTPAKSRAFVLVFVWFSFPIGEGLAVVIAKLCMDYDDGWRYLLFFVAIPAFICLLFSCLMIESPRFYYSKGQYDKAADCLNQILKSRNKPALTDFERKELKRQGDLEKAGKSQIITQIKVEDIHELSARMNDDFEKKPSKEKQIEELNKEIELNIVSPDSKPSPSSRPESKSKQSNFKDLFTKRYICLTLSISYIFFSCSYIYYGIVYILPQNLDYIQKQDEIKDYLLSNKSIFDNDQAFLGNSTDLDSINNTFVGELLSNKTFMNSTFTNSDDTSSETYDGLFLSILFELPSNVMSIFMSNSKMLGRTKSMTIGFLITMVCSLLCIFFIDNIFIFAAILKFAINIPFSIIYVYVSESYPTKIRSLGLGITNSFNRLAGIMTPVFSQLLFNVTATFPYIVFSVISVLASIVCAFLPFETLGRRLEDV